MHEDAKEQQREEALLERADRLARQIASTLLKAGGKASLIRPRLLLCAVARRLSRYGITTALRPAQAPGMMLLTAERARVPPNDWEVATKLDRLLEDPMIQLVMRCDGVSAGQVRALFHQERPRLAL